MNKKGSKPKKKSKKATEVEQIDENLSFLLETSDFCVAVSNSRPEFSVWPGAILSSFEIELLGNEKKHDFLQSDFWIYLSQVPDVNFVYIDQKRYQKIENISSLNYQLLRAFEHGSVGAKRRNFILVLSEIQGKAESVVKFVGNSN